MPRKFNTFFDPDIIIALSSIKGELISPRVLVYAWDKPANRYRPIGLIQNLKMEADNKIMPVKLEMTFPEKSSRAIAPILKKYKKMLSKYGATTK